ncbi:MAG: hypothetical protein R2861_10490 [Desulfobacterales bacterium]
MTDTGRTAEPSPIPAVCLLASDFPTAESALMTSQIHVAEDRAEKAVGKNQFALMADQRFAPFF